MKEYTTDASAAHPRHTIVIVWEQVGYAAAVELEALQGGSGSDDDAAAAMESSIESCMQQHMRSCKPQPKTIIST